MDVADLPVLDIVVLSHLHGDHFDRIAKRGLDRAVPVVSTRHAARRLRARGFRNATALGTWTTETLSRPDGSRLRITALPGRHAPGLVQALFPPVMGSLLEFEPAAGAPSLRLYVTGDTLLHDGIAEIARRYPAPDLALVHLGGTRILGVLLTMDAAQGLRLVQAVRPRVTLPIHYDDYPVFRSPLSDFRAVADERLPAGSVHYLERGGVYPLPTETTGPA